MTDSEERPGGLAAWAPRGARSGRRAHTRAGAGDRAASSRRRRLVREHDRPHHRAAGRRVPGEPVGPLVGRGPLERPPHHRRRRRGDRRRRGMSRRRCTSTPSCTASAPTRPSSCTTILRTPACSPAIGELPELVHQNSSILADELVLVTDYDGEVDQPMLGADLADTIGDASVALLVSHGVIVTAADHRGGGLQVGAVRTHVHARLARALDATRAAPDRTGAPEAAQGIAHRTCRAGVLARRRARARARRTRSPRAVVWSEERV